MMVTGLPPGGVRFVSGWLFIQILKWERGKMVDYGLRTRVTRGEGRRVLMAAASAAAASLLLVVVVGLVLPRQGLRAELDSLPPHWHQDVDSNGRCGSSERACLHRAISGSKCALNLRC